MQVPAGATSTAGAVTHGSYHDAVPYGTAGGILLDKVDTGYKGWEQSQGAYTFATGVICVPTAELISVHLTTSLWAWHLATETWCGSGYVDWMLDGVVQRTYRMLLYDGTCVTNAFTDYKEVSEGSHTVTARLWGSATPPKSGIWLDYGGDENWPGQRLTVVGEQIMGG